MRNAGRTPQGDDGAAPSPCTKICELDAPGRVCTGCGRTVVEIVRWASMTEAERRRVLARLEREWP